VNFLNSHVEGVSTIPGVHKSDPPELWQAITEQALSWKQKNFDFSFWTDSIFLENGYATQQNNQNLKMKITNDADWSYLMNIFHIVANADALTLKTDSSQQ
jgi:hypothetical protein